MCVCKTLSEKMEKEADSTLTTNFTCGVKEGLHPGSPVKQVNGQTFHIGNFCCCFPSAFFLAR